MFDRASQAGVKYYAVWDIKDVVGYRGIHGGVNRSAYDVLIEIAGGYGNLQWKSYWHIEEALDRYISEARRKNLPTDSRVDAGCGAASYGSSIDAASCERGCWSCNGDFSTAGTRPTEAASNGVPNGAATNLGTMTSHSRPVLSRLKTPLPIA